MQSYPATVHGGTEQPIYDAVFEAVLDQRLAPGTRLTEGSLTELFGVSRTIVRMALLRLAHDHIVQLKPNHGASVASPTPEETRAVFEARRMVECAALPAAIARALPKQLDNLRALVGQEDAAFHAGEVKTLDPALRRVPPAARRAGAQSRDPPLHERARHAVAADDRPVHAARPDRLRGRRARCADRRGGGQGRAPRRSAHAGAPRRLRSAAGARPARASRPPISRKRCASPPPRECRAMTFPLPFEPHSRVPCETSPLRSSPAIRATSRATARRRRTRAGRAARAWPCSSCSTTRKAPRTACCTAIPRRKPSCPRSSPRRRFPRGTCRWSRCTSTARAPACGGSCGSSASAGCR